jgi:hypothetical protein
MQQLPQQVSRRPAPHDCYLYSHRYFRLVSGWLLMRASVTGLTVPVQIHLHALRDNRSVCAMIAQ